MCSVIMVLNCLLFSKNYFYIDGGVSSDFVSFHLCMCVHNHSSLFGKLNFWDGRSSSLLLCETKNKL